MLNIEHLRKQAKLYLRWHREQYYPVAARIRAVLPRYSRLTDREILAQPFRLSDAQELVARTVGFESWEALRRGSHFVTHTRTGPLAMTTLVAAEPQLYVRDIAASSEFYSRMLGFSVAFTYGEPPFYAQVFRDGARLNLRQVDDACPRSHPARHRAVARRVDHAGGCEAALSRVSERRRRVCSIAKDRTVGRTDLHRARSGRQSPAVRRTR